MNTSLAVPVGMLPLDENRLSLKELAAKIPSKPSELSVRRWADIGLRHIRTGQTVVLETSLEGGRRFTTWERYVEFQRKMNSEDPSKEPSE